MLMALSHDKHIICEKPFTLNANQAKHIFEIANSKNLFVMEALWTRFLPLTQEIVKQVSDGLIGTIKEAKMYFSFMAKKEKTSRLFDPKLGGGALLDIGLYPIVYANLLFGRPNHIEVNSIEMYNKVDINSTLAYHYNKHKVIMKSSFKHAERVEIILTGEKGQIKIPNFVGGQFAMIYDNKKNLISKIEMPFECNGFEYQIRDAVACISNKKTQSTISSHHHTIEILSQMDDIRSLWHLSYPDEALV